MSSVNDPTPAAGATQPTPAADAVQAAPPPASPVGVQATPPPAEAPVIPIPPRPARPPLTAEELGRATARLDRILIALVLIFVALVACFPVRNTDFWLHLAAA